jgi:hypothetical protein
LSIRCRRGDKRVPQAADEFVSEAAALPMRDARSHVAYCMK